jgi:hypothetical protein
VKIIKAIAAISLSASIHATENQSNDKEEIKPKSMEFKIDLGFLALGIADVSVRCEAQ